MDNGHQYKSMLEKGIPNLTLTLRTFILTPVPIVIIVIIFIPKPQMCFSWFGDTLDGEGSSSHNQYSRGIIDGGRQMSYRAGY